MYENKVTNNSNMTFEKLSREFDRSLDTVRSKRINDLDSPKVYKL